MVFSKIQIKRIAREAAEKLSGKYSVTAVILFGSYAKGMENERSDIDLAFISDKFQRMTDYKRSSILLDIIHQIILPEPKDIEPVGLTKKEFENPKEFSLASQIKKTGKVVFKKT